MDAITHRATLSRRWPAVALIGIGLVYAWAILALDQRAGARDSVRMLLPVFPLALAATALHILLRYWRWRLLLALDNHRFGVIEGFLAYCSGFAFTASPGKVGELIRIRYFSQMGVPPETTIACFIFERLLDLFCLLLLAGLLLDNPSMLAVAATFVFAICLSVITLGKSRGLANRGLRAVRCVGARRAARWLIILREGIAGALRYFTPLTTLWAMAIGLAAWAVLGLSLVVLASALGVPASPSAIFAIHPTSTLVGAASMLPGGLGSTEAAMTYMLHQTGISMQIAALVAIAARIASLWVAMAVGLVSMLILELRFRRAGRISAAR